MTWHVTTVPAEQLAAALAEIRRVGGIVTISLPQADSVCLTWTSADRD